MWYYFQAHGALFFLQLRGRGRGGAGPYYHKDHYKGACDQVRRTRGNTRIRRKIRAEVGLRKRARDVRELIVKHDTLHIFEPRFSVLQPGLGVLPQSNDP